MTKLKWAPYPEAKIASYRVYRSILGFTAPILTTLAGKTLTLKINGGALQTVNFTGGSVIDDINNAIVGGKAYQSQADLNQFVFRGDLREAPGSIQIVGGTALGDLSLTARIITEKSEDVLLATVPALADPNSFVEFTDPDGCPSDWYAVTTVDPGGCESLKSNYRQAITGGGSLCVIEGIIVNLQGARVVDAEILATIQVPPESGATQAFISTDTISTLSGSDGRFAIALLQGAIVKFECEKIGLTRMIRVPDKPFAFINDIRVDLDYRYPLGYRG